ELWTDEQGQLVPTAFYMTSGQQKFLKEVRRLVENVATGTRIGRRTKAAAEMFEEALFGPWRYEDVQHSLGWDPATERLHALRARSPTKEASEGVAAAVALAFEAIPLFPCFVDGRQMKTTGFPTRPSGGRRSISYFTWPLWECPLPLDSVRSLV